MTTYSDKTYKQDRTLPEFPRLIFFDTNIVQNLYEFRELIYENSLSSKMNSKILAKGSRFTEDIMALADLMALGHRAGWPIAVSSRTLGELGATPRLVKRFALTNWGEKLADYFISNSDESQDVIEESIYSESSHFTFIQRSRLSDMLETLPQEADRQLIIDALECGCDFFLTMDYKTVWNYRHEVNRFGLQVMRPVELLEHVRPWAGLLR